MSACQTKVKATYSWGYQRARHLSVYHGVLDYTEELGMEPTGPESNNYLSAGPHGG